MEYAHRQLSSADLKNLVGSPIQLIPAPGPKRFLLVQAVTFFYKFNTTAYGNVGALNDQNLELRLGVAFVLGLDSLNFLDKIVSATAMPGLFINTTGSYMTADTSQVENAALFIHNGEPLDLTLGDGTLDVWVVYTPLPVP